MKKSEDKKIEVELVKEVFLLPVYYLVYIKNAIKTKFRVDYKNFSNSEIKYHATFMFIGLLLINFSLYIFEEFNIIEYDFNEMINEVYFITMYFKAFSLYVIYALALYLIIRKKEKNFNIFKATIVSGLKMFNIIYPLFFIYTIFLVDSILSGTFKINEIDLIIILGLAGIVFILLWKQSLHILEKFYKIGRFKNIKVIALVVMILLINIQIISFEPMKIKAKQLIHIESLCEQKIHQDLFRKKLFTNYKDLTFDKYVLGMHKCQEETNKLLDIKYN